MRKWEVRYGHISFTCMRFSTINSFRKEQPCADNSDKFYTCHAMLYWKDLESQRGTAPEVRAPPVIVSCGIHMVFTRMISKM